MSFKIGTTDVIDNSRNLTNITNQDEWVNNGMSSAATSAAVGTYAVLHRTCIVNDRGDVTNGTVTENNTYSGTSLTWAGVGGMSNSPYNADPRNDGQQTNYAGTRSSTGLTGTWRAHGRHNLTGITLFVRTA